MTEEALTTQLFLCFSFYFPLFLFLFYFIEFVKRQVGWAEGSKGWECYCQHQLHLTGGQNSNEAGLPNSSTVPFRACVCVYISMNTISTRPKPWSTEQPQLAHLEKKLPMYLMGLSFKFPPDLCATLNPLLMVRGMFFMSHSPLVPSVWYLFGQSEELMFIRKTRACIRVLYTFNGSYCLQIISLKKTN